MGRLLARLFKTKTNRVIICGRDENKTKKAAAHVHVEAGNITEVAQANIVVVSVPIEDTVEVCRYVLEKMRGNSVLVEISSVKTGIVDKIVEMVPPEIEYLSLHPLFGPSVRRPEAQSIITIPAKPGPISRRMLDCIHDMGFTTHVCTMEEHDRMMAVMQVMHHYAYLVMAVALAKMITENRITSRFATRSLKITWRQLHSLQKINRTVIGIQRLNPCGSAARRSYAEVAQRMTTMNDQVISEIEEAMKTIDDWIRK
jgi:prephenate dehydrogenase